MTSGTSTGSPHYSAGSFYDLVTGRGTPKANLVVSSLVSATASATAAVTTSATAGTSSRAAPHHSGDVQAPVPGANQTIILVIRVDAPRAPDGIVNPVLLTTPPSRNAVPVVEPASRGLPLSIESRVIGGVGEGVPADDAPDAPDAPGGKQNPALVMLVSSDKPTAALAAVVSWQVAGAELQAPGSTVAGDSMTASLDGGQAPKAPVSAAAVTLAFAMMGFGSTRAAEPEPRRQWRLRVLRV